jgi:hypothetical protein
MLLITRTYTCIIFELVTTLHYLPFLLCSWSSLPLFSYLDSTMDTLYTWKTLEKETATEVLKKEQIPIKDFIQLCESGLSCERTMLLRQRILQSTPQSRQSARLFLPSSELGPPHPPPTPRKL